MASVAPSRLVALARLQSTIFQTAYNPTSMRTGAKYLRRRLQGPSMVNYYPKNLTIATLNRQLAPEDRLVDRAETQRLQDIVDRKKRGKGTPKKAKSKGMH
ncbi:mitochondrial ribosomal subunit S27-domain-containing protein, partial [Amylostereum chailletii]